MAAYNVCEDCAGTGDDVSCRDSDGKFMECRSCKGHGVQIKAKHRVRGEE